MITGIDLTADLVETRVQFLRRQFGAGEEASVRRLLDAQAFRLHAGPHRDSRGAQVGLRVLCVDGAPLEIERPFRCPVVDRPPRDFPAVAQRIDTPVRQFTLGPITECITVRIRRRHWQQHIRPFAGGDAQDREWALRSRVLSAHHHGEHRCGNAHAVGDFHLELVRRARCVDGAGRPPAEAPGGIDAGGRRTTRHVGDEIAERIAVRIHGTHHEVELAASLHLLRRDAHDRRALRPVHRQPHLPTGQNRRAKPG